MNSYHTTFPTIMKAAVLTKIISSREIDILIHRINNPVRRIDYAERFQQDFEPCSLRMSDILTHKDIFKKQNKRRKGTTSKAALAIPDFTPEEQAQVDTFTDVIFVGIHYKTKDWLTPVYQLMIGEVEGFEYYIDNKRIAVLK